MTHVPLSFFVCSSRLPFYLSCVALWNDSALFPYRTRGATLGTWPITARLANLGRRPTVKMLLFRVFRLRCLLPWSCTERAFPAYNAVFISLRDLVDLFHENAQSTYASTLCRVHPKPHHSVAANWVSSAVIYGKASNCHALYISLCHLSSLSFLFSRARNPGKRFRSRRELIRRWHLPYTVGIRTNCTNQRSHSSTGGSL